MKKNLALFTLVLGSSLLISSSASAVGLQNVASFNGNNGDGPLGSLTYDSSNGLFYGTTQYGGDNNLNNGHGGGAIFSVSPSGTLSNVASFNGSANPRGDLTYDSSTGLFYGTTQAGGTSDGGTIFSVSPSGTLSNVASFYGTSGYSPLGSLTYDNSNGLFYGTTSGGGTNYDGTIFSVSPSGNLNTVASFNGTNGSGPQGSLTYDSSNGLFYGTTNGGGTSRDGTIFSVSPSGTLSNVASFYGGASGIAPAGSLTYDNSNGLFYGTTQYGGDTNNDGTIFSVSPSGTLSNVASFDRSTTGAQPFGSLTYDSSTGLFYGTTSGGGANNDGTIFSVSPSGTLSNVASFNYTNGANPYGSLTYDSSTGLFYGTTYFGGANNVGTIFSFDPGTAIVPEPQNILGAIAALGLGATVKRKVK